MRTYFTHALLLLYSCFTGRLRFFLFTELALGERADRGVGGKLGALLPIEHLCWRCAQLLVPIYLRVYETHALREAESAACSCFGNLSGVARLLDIKSTLRAFQFTAYSFRD